MLLLTKEQLKERKNETRKEEIRQNVKSHCTKIRDGIRQNDTTSGERAIWELFQNARDLSYSAYPAEIKITLTDKEFVFAHKGKAFTFDSLCSLVKQVSSHSKEDDKSVGQYGTGFLTTHKFGRKITINGSMLICENPKVYVDVSNFEINRENFDDIPKFIDDMTNQIKAVEDLMDAEQMSTPREWTEFHYELDEKRTAIATKAIEQAIKFMPYVLTFNDHIGSCTIEKNYHTISFRKEDKTTSIDELRCKRIVKSEDGHSVNIDCYYLELDNGDSRILLPLKNETEVYDFGDVPRLFVHFPLIGENYFNVNFLFHSHRFIPEEKRDNIIVPKDNDATTSIAKNNNVILDAMTQYLWDFLEAHVHTWNNAILMASINIKDSGFTEKETNEYYKTLKEGWVKEFQKLKLIEIDGRRYSMNDEEHPLVLESPLESFLSDNAEKGYLDTIYPYAKSAGLIPCKEKLLLWSKIIGVWDGDKKENFLSLKDVVKSVSQQKGGRLLDMLKMLVEAKATSFFENYELIPNREGVLRKRDDLCDARAISSELYRLVKAIDAKICEKMVDTEYQDIIKLTLYNRQNLRMELNEVVKAKEAECWNAEGNSHPYDSKFEKSIIALCSTFTTVNGDSKRSKLMPIICRFEGIEGYGEIFIPAANDDQIGFDLYRQVFISLVENQMMKICQNNKQWVVKNISDLVDFVDNARGDDYKNFCTQYAIYPNMNGELYKPEDLKKNQNVDEPLFGFYEKVIGDDLKSKCVDSRFEGFFPKYAEEAYQYSSPSVALEIQNKLSANEYKDTILLDIIDLTEQEGCEGSKWKLLFKDIYDQRESIRYKLGSAEERKAINRMMKQNNPQLLIKMADVSESENADIVLDKIDEAIYNYEHEEHIKKLGCYVESHIQEFLTEALKTVGVKVSNVQDGQDLIISKEGYDDYFVEIKSRWENKASAIMSAAQFQKAVAYPTRYALISAQMWDYSQEDALADVRVTLDVFDPLIKVCDNIGTLEAELKNRVDEAFRNDEDEIHAEGSYQILVPQKLITKNFNELVAELSKIFS